MAGPAGESPIDDFCSDGMDDGVVQDVANGPVERAGEVNTFYQYISGYYQGQ